MKTSLTALYLLFLVSYTYGQTEIEHKVYDTEFGRFDLWIYGDQLNGSYEIAPKKIIGSISAELNGLTAVGRWVDPDGEGDIEIFFKEGLKEFRADYRGDDEPDKWYRDQWHGKLRTDGGNLPCAGAAYDLISPFIGIWEEFRLNDKDEEEFIGTLSKCSFLPLFLPIIVKSLN